MIDIELLPCPFCGGEATVRHIDRQDDWWVSCDKCRVQRPSVQGIVHSRAEAVTAWNCRTPALEAQLAAIVPDHVRLWINALINHGEQDNALVVTARATREWLDGLQKTVK